MSSRFASSSDRAAREEDDHDNNDSFETTFSAGELNVKAIHYYHNASYHSSQASIRTPTATAVTWKPAYGEKAVNDYEEEEEDDDSRHGSPRGGCGPGPRPGGAPPSPQKIRVSRGRPSPEDRAIMVHQPNYLQDYAVDSPFLCGAPGMPFAGKTQQQLEAEAEADTVVVNNKAKKGLTHTMKNMMQKLAKRVLHNNNSDNNDPSKLQQQFNHKDVVLATPPRVAKTPVTWSYSPQSRSPDHDDHDAPQNYDDDLSTTSPLRKGMLFDDEEEEDDIIAPPPPQRQDSSSSEICATTILMETNTTAAAASNQPIGGKLILTTIKHQQQQQAQRQQQQQPTVSTRTSSGPVDLDESLPSSLEESFETRQSLGSESQTLIDLNETLQSVDDSLADAMDLNNVTVDQALDGSFAFQQHEVRLKMPSRSGNQTIPEVSEEEEHDDDDTEKETSKRSVDVDLESTPSLDDQSNRQDSARQSTATAVDLDDSIDSSSSDCILYPPRMYGTRTGPVIRGLGSKGQDAKQHRSLLPPRPPASTPPKQQDQLQAKFKIVKVFGHPAPPAASASNSQELNTSQESGDEVPLLNHHQQLRAEDFTVGPIDMNLGTASSILDTTCASNKPELALAAPILDESFTAAMEDEDEFPTEGKQIFRQERIQHAFDEACKNDGRQYSKPVDDQDLTDSLAWTSKRSFATAPPIAKPTTMPALRLPASVRDSPRHFDATKQPSSGEANQSSTSIVLQHVIPPRDTSTCSEPTETVTPPLSESMDALYSASMSFSKKDASDVAPLPPSNGDSPRRSAGANKFEEADSVVTTVLLQSIIPPWQNSSMSHENDLTEPTQKEVPSAEAGTQEDASTSVVPSAASSKDADMMFQTIPVGSAVVELNDMDGPMEDIGELAVDASTAQGLPDQENDQPQLDSDVQSILEDLEEANHQEQENNMVAPPSKQEIRPKSFSERPSRLPPPAFKGTQVRLPALWEAPRSRRRDGEYTGPVDLDDTIDITRDGKDDVYTGPVDLDDSIASSEPDQEDDELSTVDENVAVQKQAEDAGTPHGNRSTIDWNAFADDADSSGDSSHSEMFFTEVAVPCKKQPDSHADWTEPKLSSSDDDSCAVHTGCISPFRLKSANDKDADWAQNGEQANAKKSNGTDAHPQDTHVAKPAKLAKHPKDTPLVARQKSWRESTDKSDQPSWCDFNMSESKSLGIHRELAETAVAGPRDQTPKAATSATKPEEGEKSPSPDPTKQGACSQAQDVPYDPNSPGKPENSEDVGESATEIDDSFDKLMNSDDSVSATDLIHHEFKSVVLDRDSSTSIDGDIGDIDESALDDSTAMEVERFKKICMQNAMSARIPKAEEDDTVTSSVVSDIKHAKEAYASVMMELERVFLPRLLQERQEEGAHEELVKEVEPVVAEMLVAEETSVAKEDPVVDVEDARSGDAREDPVVDADQQDIQEQIRRSLEVAAEAQAKLDISMLESEIKKLQATAKALREERAETPKKTDSETTPANPVEEIDSAPTPAESQQIAGIDNRTGSSTLQSTPTKQVIGIDIGKSIPKTPSKQVIGMDIGKSSPQLSVIGYNLNVSRASSRLSHPFDESSSVKSTPCKQPGLSVSSISIASGNEADDECGFAGDASTQDCSVISGRIGAGLDVASDAGTERTAAATSNDHVAAGMQEASNKTDEVWALPFGVSMDSQDEVGQSESSVASMRGKSKKERRKTPLGKRMVNAFNRLRRTGSPRRKGQREPSHLSCTDHDREEAQSEEILKQLKMKTQVVEQIGRVPGLSENLDPSSYKALISDNDASYDFQQVPKANLRQTRTPREKKKQACQLKPLAPPRSSNQRNRPRPRRLPGTPEGTAIFEADFTQFEARNLFPFEPEDVLAGSPFSVKKPDPTPGGIDDTVCLEDRMITYLLQGIDPPGADPTPANENFHNLTFTEDPPGSAASCNEAEQPEEVAALEGEASAQEVSMEEEAMSALTPQNDTSQETSLCSYGQRPTSLDPHFERLVDSLVQRAIESDISLSIDLDELAKKLPSLPKAATQKAPNVIVVETVDEQSLSSDTPGHVSMETPTQSRFASRNRTPQTIRTCTTAPLTPQTIGSFSSHAKHTSFSEDDASVASVNASCTDVSFLGIRDSVTGLPVEVPEVCNISQEVETNLKDMSISEALSVECTWESFSMRDRRRLIPPTIPEHPEEEEPTVASPPANSKTGGNKELTEKSPTSVVELGNSYFNQTITLESSGFSNYSEESSFGNAPQPLASDEEYSPVRPHDSMLLKKSYNLVRSTTPDRKTRTRTARNDATPTTQCSDSSEDNMLNPCVYTFPV
ncbi:expressed unknown protein [Seminavis robusta]|uniref:Uncharacterized protein n=1 Tax=Seminavis robusta TaxID=568900 RepID=A0A9N8DEY2_9STRA|nr:expressed unknown protein [Seminavis robusta]|eukprot:Sro124_g060000.1 n/a (2317) ;mRNA; f:89921-96985